MVAVPRGGGRTLLAHISPPRACAPYARGGRLGFACAAATSCSEQGGMDGDAQHATDTAAASALGGSSADGMPAAAHERLEQPGALRASAAACARACVRACAAWRACAAERDESADAKRARVHFRSTARRPAVSSARAAWQARARTHRVVCTVTRHTRSLLTAMPPLLGLRRPGFRAARALHAAAPSPRTSAGATRTTCCTRPAAATLRSACLATQRCSLLHFCRRSTAAMRTPTPALPRRRYWRLRRQRWLRRRCSRLEAPALLRQMRTSFDFLQSRRRRCRRRLRGARTRRLPRSRRWRRSCT